MYFPKVTRPRPILFDLGDTLINFIATNPLPYIEECTRLVYQRMEQDGVQLPRFKSYYRQIKHRSYLAFAWAELRRREVDLIGAMHRVHCDLRLPADWEYLMLLADRFYIPHKQLGKAEENIHQVLDQLTAVGHPLAIVSNTMVPGPLLDQHLFEEDLLRYFPVRIYSCDVGVRKPHSAIFRAALRGLNARPQDAIFIGDKLHLDVKGAHLLGMTTILKLRKGPMPWRGPRPDHVVRHLQELPELLRAIGAQYVDDVVVLDGYPAPVQPLSKHPGPSYARAARAYRLHT
ncbi:MAG: Phosphoglycolate phosphatase [Phycisphaerae bacterium]|nr:Phosphoglycolate phosphatase [Phycisphaerae bacterium]